MDDSNYYVFCVAESVPDDFSPRVDGYRDESVFGVTYSGLTAFTCKTPYTSIEPTYDNLKRHEDAIASIMENFDTLPMSFSTIFKSEDDIKSVLKKYDGQFKENFIRIKGKFELGLKIFYKIEGVGGAFDKNKTILPGEMSPKEYMMKRYASYREAQRQEEEPMERIKGFHNILSCISAESCFTNPMRNNLVFNGSYLVAKDDKARFDLAVRKIIDDNPEMKMFYSGPWPAYHFIKLVREGEEDE